MGPVDCFELPLVGDDFFRGLKMYEKNSVVYIYDLYV